MYCITVINSLIANPVNHSNGRTITKATIKVNVIAAVEFLFLNNLNHFRYIGHKPIDNKTAQAIGSQNRYKMVPAPNKISTIKALCTV
jgi:hypothetical protein